MALYDTLSFLNLTPQGFLGHSSGEILCGYADGSFTAEQVLLCHHFLGISFLENNQNLKIPGAMATLGLSAHEAGSKCPPGVHVAGINSTLTVTVSGEESKIHNFVQTLANNGVSVRKLNSCRIAAHSPLIHGASKIFEKYLENESVCPVGTPRSSKWVSSSLDESEWGKDLARNNSIPYHVNNLQSPVLFHNAVKHIPKDAAVIEIGPKSTMEAVLKDSLAPKNLLVALMTSNQESDQLRHFVESLGKIYNAGVNVNLSGLYPTVAFPVSATAPSLSSLVRWDHSHSWLTPIVPNTAVRKSNPRFQHSRSVLKSVSLNYTAVLSIKGFQLYSQKKILSGLITDIDISSSDEEYLKGHKLDDKIVYRKSYNYLSNSTFLTIN
jgi:fatty acid synthase, animal type